MTGDLRPRTRRGGRLGLVGSVVLLGALLQPQLGTVANAEPNEGTTAVSTNDQRRITAGGLHTCAVRDDGHVRCWGNNANGQLGNGTTAASTEPEEVTGITTALGVSAGSTHTCALIHDGTVRCWGNNGSGQLGNGTTTPPDPPVLEPVPVRPVVGLDNATAIAAGGFHTCALRADTTVACWGHDGSGQLGDGPGPGTSYVPVTAIHDHDADNTTPMVALSGVKAVAAGEYHTCAVLDTGAVKCWGHNGFGQLGNGGTGDSDVAVAVSGIPDNDSHAHDPHKALAVSGGESHTCAVLDDNTARCWGQNAFGQLGNNASGAGTDSNVPVKVLYDADGSSLTTDDIDPLPGVIAITTGQFHSCARLLGDTARCWGQNGRSQLGNGNTTDQKTAIVVNGGVATQTGVRAITAGGFHTCILGPGNTMRCWGSNFYGQLGAYDDQRNTPVTVTALAGAKAVVSTGDDHACALVAGPEDPPPLRPTCWGNNASGELGAHLSPSPADTTVPVPVHNFPNASSVSAGNEHVCALPAGSGAPRCWGRNSDGELGNGTFTSSDQPVAVSGITTATHVSAGGRLSGVELGHTCSLLADESVWCWGANNSGQLGNNVALPGADRNTPVRVQSDDNDDHLNVPDPAITPPVPLTGAKSIATGGAHACARMADNRVRCWGANESGQLGDGTHGARAFAVTVDENELEPDADEDPLNFDPLENVVEVTAGAAHSCARKSDNTIWCWGRGSQGQLGQGSFASSDKPVQVVGLPGGTVPLAITAGDNHTCARLYKFVRRNTMAVCWGADNQGQLGDDEPTVNKHTPVVPFHLDEPGEGTDIDLVTMISGGRNNTCALLVDTTVSCWGDNTFGQLGDGIGAMSKAIVAVQNLGSVGGNDIPVPDDDTASTAPGASVVIPVLVGDTDPDNSPNPLSVASATNGARGTTAVNAGTTVTYTPSTNFCSIDPTSKLDTFTYEVTDGVAIVPASVTVEVTCPNTAPTAVDDTAATNEETAVDVVVVANDTDPNGTAVTIKAGSVTDPTNGATTVSADNRTITYTPDVDFFGSDTFDYVATDGIDDSVVATVTVTVADVNDAPTAVDDSATTAEDTAATIDVVANDGDTEGTALAVSSVTDPAHGTTVRSTPTQVTYTPDPGYCGSDGFSYDVSDGKSVDTATVSVTVTCTNDGPNAVDDSGTVDEDSQVVIDVLANDTDPEGDPLTVSAVTDPPHGTATINGGTTITYKPDPDFCTTDGFGYTVSDSSGETDSAVVVPVVVVCHNDAPVAADDAVATAEDSSAAITVLANDSDVDQDALTVTGATDPAHGSAVLGSSNVVTYTPDADFCGSDSFTYTATDGHGTADDAVVSVTVTCVNDAPVLAPIPAQSSHWGETANVPLSASDVDGDTLGYSLVAGPAGASVVESPPGSFVVAWTPTSSQVGTHTFTVRAGDGALSDDESFTFTVTKRPTVLLYQGVANAQYSDPAAVSAKLVDFGGNPVPGAGLSFRIGTRTATGTTDGTGVGGGSIVLDGPVGTTSVTTGYAGDAAYMPTSLSSAFTIDKELVNVTFTGRHLTTTAGSSAPVALSARVVEEADGSVGSGIATLQVDFVELSGLVLCTGSVSAVTAGEGTATCTSPALGLGSRAVIARVRGANYAGPVDVGAFAVAQAPSGSASGGGRVVDPGDSSAADFAFNALPVRRSAPTGSAVHIRRSGGVATVVAGTSLTSMSVGCSGGKTKVCSTLVEGTSASRWSVNLADGAVSAWAGTSSFRIDATDVAESGSSPPPDRYAVALTGADTYALGSPAARTGGALARRLW